MMRRIDHGTTLVHDMKGNPRNRLDQVSVPWAAHRDSPDKVAKALPGYRYHHGWVDRAGMHWAFYTKELPLAMPRQTCCVCLRTTDDYTSRKVDHRTPSEIKRGVTDGVGTYHYCLRPACQQRYSEELALA